MKPARVLISSLLMTSLLSCRSTHQSSDLQGASPALTLKSLNGGFFTLNTGTGPNKCLDVPNGGANNLQKLQQSDCNGNLAQLFRFDQRTDGSWKILGVQSGKCLDIDAKNFNDRSQLELYSCNPSDSQRFNVKDRGNGSFEIVHIKSNKCLDVDRNSPANGTPVQLWSCNNGTAQRWMPVALNRALRIMPLGASITQGVGGTKAGTRGYLHTLLDGARFPHVFVGSNKDQPGDLPEGQRNHEGHPGWTIADIPGKSQGIQQRTAEWVRAARPDFVLILVGSNDINLKYKTDEMGARIYTLVDTILNKTNGAAPYARVLVASLPMIGDSAAEAVSVNYSKQLVATVARLKSENKNVDFVDVHADIKPEDKADNLHPNDKGHQKIANIWLNRLMGN